MTDSAPASPVLVRPARPEDAETMLSLVAALARYERLEPPTPEAQRRLVQDAFGPNPRFTLLLAELSTSADSSKIVGYAFVLETYSTFLALPTLYLEDLFVLPEHRGVGAGRELFRAVVAEAERRGCGRVEWLVLDWNRLARDFYDRYGADHLDDWCFYRLTREKFGSVTGTRTQIA